jgi:CHAT domain-containing protein
LSGRLSFAVVAFLLLAALAGLGWAVKSVRDRAAAEDALRAGAFVDAQWASTSAAGAALAEVGARFADAGGGLGDLVRRRQDLREAWRAADRERSAALTLDRAAATAVLDAATARQADLERLIGEVDRQLAERFPRFQDLARPEPLREDEVRALLGPDEALILVLPTPEDSFVFAVTRETADWVRVDRTETELAADVGALRASVDPHGPSRAAESAFAGDADTDPTQGRQSFPRGIAHDLHLRLLKPLEATWGPKRRLIFVTSGALTSLPFGLFVTEAPIGADDDPVALRETAWLVRRHAPVTLPTVSSLATLRVLAPAQTSTEAFRGFGSPALDGARGLARGAAPEPLARGGRVDVDAVRRLSPLPATEGELKALAASLGAPAGSLLVGAAATESAVKRADLSHTRIVAFATHGLIAGELGGLAEPALVMTPPRVATAEDDGLLTASEAARLHLSADWVLLSACNTASGDGRAGADGLSGLARAFFYAGARSLLVSHWPVQDDAAAALTTGALQRLDREPGIGRAEALRRSMVALIDREDAPRFAHPASWAPFVVVGEGR